MSVYGSIPASPEEAEAFAGQLTEAYLHCRVWGHDPFPQNIRVARDVEGVPNAHWDADMGCTHGCGVRWKMLVSIDGELLRRRLDYSEAPGYISEYGRIDANGKKVLRKTFFAQSVSAKKARKGKR